MKEEFLQNIPEIYLDAVNTWNDQVAKIIKIFTQTPAKWSPEAYQEALKIAGILLPIAVALLSLIFVIGMFRNSSNMLEHRSPQTVAKAFLRFVLAMAGVEYVVGAASELRGYSLLQTIDNIVYGIVNLIYKGESSVGQIDVTNANETVQKLITGSGWGDAFSGILLTVIFQLACLAMTIVLWLHVFNRFFTIYLMVGIAPLPMAFFGSESTQRVGIGFLKTYTIKLAEVIVMIIALAIYSGFQASMDSVVGVSTSYNMYLVRQLLVMTMLVVAIRGSDSLLKEIAG